MGYLEALFDPTQSGVTLLEIDRWTLAEELWSCGEDSLYREPLRMDEGRRRALARRRRRRQADRPEFNKTPEERYADINRIEESEHFPELWR